MPTILTPYENDPALDTLSSGMYAFIAGSYGSASVGFTCFSYIDKREFPEATRLLKDALMVMEATRSWTNIARIAQLYRLLKASPYGNSFDVAQLGVDLLKIQHPEIFGQESDV